ncbi:MAG: hypothetical protein Q9219_002909 [cf. Caloplaca sp. 3 TL-2023]
MEFQYANTTICQPQPPAPVLPAPPPVYNTPLQVVQPPAYLQVPPPPPVGTITTTTTTHHEVQPQQAPAKHTCAACGKFRSASYHYRHPLASVRSSKTLNAHVRKQESMMLADGLIIGPFHQKGGTAPLAMNCDEDTIGIGPPTKTEGIEGSLGRARASVLKFTLSDRQKRDVDQEALRIVSALFAAFEQAKNDPDLLLGRNIVTVPLMVIIAMRNTTQMNTLSMMTLSMDARVREAGIVAPSTAPTVLMKTMSAFLQRFQEGDV